MDDKWDLRIKNVTWGYRERFFEALKKIRDSGQLGESADDPSYQAFDKSYMELVGREYSIDHAANAFLQALYKNLCWIISIPELMESWSGYGIKLLNNRLSYAIRYFELWDEKLNISDASEMRFIMDMLQIIEARSDANGALAFLEGYSSIRENLPVEKIQVFIEEGLKMFADNLNILERFFKLEIASSKKLIEQIGTRCCLKDVKSRLERLVKSICRADINIDEISRLDTDELIEKGSKTVCFFNSLHLPSKVAAFEESELNKKWYLAAAYANGFAHLFNGFPSVHGLSGFESSENFLRNYKKKSDALSLELFYILDIYRIFSMAFKIFPGTKAIISEVIKGEIDIASGKIKFSLFDILIYHLLCDANTSNFIIDDVGYTDKVRPFIEYIKNISVDWHSFYDVANNLSVILTTFKEIFDSDAAMSICNRGVLTFYSDYNYRTEVQQTPQVSNKPSNRNQSQDKQGAEENNEYKEEEAQAPFNINASNLNGNKYSESKDKSSRFGHTGFIYDEWNNNTQDYLCDWCRVFENKNIYMNNANVIEESLWKKQVKDIRKVFERIKPDLLKKQKDLLAGDEVELFSLVNYIIDKKAGLSPQEKIYSKIFKDQRDICTALLIDTSGSTSESVEGKKVIEIEKNAALLLAEGLTELGDDFGIFGFCSAGKDECSYFIFKEFEEEWKKEQQQRLMRCASFGSTRIGAAIRHTTNKLKKQANQKKIIIVITDGKPQDSDGYTARDLYAQNDVRMACIEAKRNGIAVFCLSTENNSISELELMFPVKRYVIMRNITELPSLLAKSYIKLTI